MTSFDNFEVPQHLSGILQLHSEISKRLRIGKEDLTPVEVTNLKKQKLALRDAIAKAPYDPDQGPPISEILLYPLTLDTLQLLKKRLESKLLQIKRSYGPTSPKIAKTEAVINLVAARIKQLSPSSSSSREPELSEAA
jgi:hypothetical protein